MSQVNQKTISGSVSVQGIGVHSGAPATLTFLPGEPNSGILFRRTDLEGSPEIPVDLEHVCGTELGTSLGEGEGSLSSQARNLRSWTVALGNT
jgi:UDP-3-O-acyl-N-acetylglucosamine deacetylase